MVEMELVRKLVDVKTPIRTMYLDMSGSENFDLTPLFFMEFDDDKRTGMMMNLDTNG